MTEIYDSETLRAIVAEAKRQGFDDRTIALNLSIAHDDPSFGFEGEDQTRATISEYSKRGCSRESIAAKLNLPIKEIVRIEGDPDLRVGLYKAVYRIHPNDPHSEQNILRLVERGRASLDKSTRNELTRSGRQALLRNATTTETLALLVDSLGLEGARKLIAHFVHVIGSSEDAATALHIPKAAAWAVMTGSFPTEVPAGDHAANARCSRNAVDATVSIH